MRVVLELARVVATLLSHPLLLASVQVTFELSIVFANYSLRWIVEAITNIIGAFRDILWTPDIVADERHSIRAESLKLFSIESSILDRTIVPLLVLELQVVVEEVLSFDQFTTIPLRYVATLE